MNPQDLTKGLIHFELGVFWGPRGFSFWQVELVGVLGGGGLATALHGAVAVGRHEYGGVGFFRFDLPLC